MSIVKEGLFYSASHEWLEKKENSARIGLSDHAQYELGDIVFVNLPEIGDEIVAGKACCDVESVKAVADVIAPSSGVVIAVNEDLIDNPGLINEDCYGAWICEIEQSGDSLPLFDARQYAAVLAEAE